MVAQLAFGMDNDYKCDLEIWGSLGTITSNRILTAPVGFVPSYTIKKNQSYEKRELLADDSFYKSIMHFELCIKDEVSRIVNYKAIEQQQKLVEDYRELSRMV